jgi:hypothetical protein
MEKITNRKLYELIKQEQSFGNYDECIHCKQESRYYPNPYYMHVCDVCGHKGSSSDLSTSWTDTRIIEIMELLR